MKKRKIFIVIGARPQFIKAAALADAFRRGPWKKNLALVWLHTGQHYDASLSDIFFRELKLPKPKYRLHVGALSPISQLALMVEGIEKALLAERPDWVLVFGDTNSTLAGALAAAKLCIPIAHVEAGLRSHNRQMPEEANRILTDRLSAALFCPDKDSARQLSTEGIRKNVYAVGDVMADLLHFHRFSKKKTAVRKPYYLATIHRNTNTDIPRRLKSVFKALAALDKEVIMPLHPRTAGRIAEDSSLKKIVCSARHLRLIRPVSYLKMLELEKNSEGIITDSGGVQKEAFWLGVPCVTIREETEWGETVRSGLNRLCPPDAGHIREAFRRMSRISKIQRPAGLGASTKILGILSKAAK